MVVPIPGITRNPRYHADDIAELFGNGGTVKLLYETADANANALIFVAPEGGAVDVPVYIFGDASIENVDLTWFNGVTEPTIAVVNDAADAYVSLDSGDDAVAGSKGLYYKAAADEDIELLNLSVTGTPRIYWDESEDQFRSTKGWVFDAACDVQGTWVATATWTLPAFTLGGSVTVNAQLFDAGAGNVEIRTTGEDAGLLVRSTQGGASGTLVQGYHLSASPAINDRLLIVRAYGNDDAAVATTYSEMRFLIEDPVNTSEDGKMAWFNAVAGVLNEAMTLSSLGELGVDVSGDSGTYANVELFDEYDDALVLRQGIQQRNRELLANLGVLKRKDTGSGYMMQIQPMVRLLAGGIYQTRQMLEDTRDRLDARIKLVEKQLPLLPQAKEAK